MAGAGDMGFEKAGEPGVSGVSNLMPERGYGVDGAGGAISIRPER